eukprot:COSAG01_NODE_4377_length_5085_cov_6.039110_7_plen_386_part_00
MLVVHLAVLGQLEYFVAYLARWADGSETLELELPEPCDSGDFLTLLRHLYGMQLELTSLGAALRAALVGSFLGAGDNILAQIRFAIPKLVQTADDAAAVRLFLSCRELPDMFADLCPVARAPMSSKQITEMVKSAVFARQTFSVLGSEEELESEDDRQIDDEECLQRRQLAATAVAARHFPEDLVVYTNTGDAHGCRWFLGMHAEHVSATRRIELFVAGTQDLSHVDDEIKLIWQEEFARHLRTHPSVTAVAIAAQSYYRGDSFAEQERRRIYTNIFFAESPTIRAALAIALRQGGEVAATLGSAKPDDLSKILDLDVLSALEDDVPCLTKLIGHYAFTHWLKSDAEGKLAAMSFEGRRAVCAELSTKLAELDPAIVAIVQSELV